MGAEGAKADQCASAVGGESVEGTEGGEGAVGTEGGEYCGC